MSSPYVIYAELDDGYFLININFEYYHKNEVSAIPSYGQGTASLTHRSEAYRSVLTGASGGTGIDLACLNATI